MTWGLQHSVAHICFSGSPSAHQMGVWPGKFRQQLTITKLTKQFSIKFPAHCWVGMVNNFTAWVHMTEDIFIYPPSMTLQWDTQSKQICCCTLLSKTTVFAAVVVNTPGMKIALEEHQLRCWMLQQTTCLSSCKRVGWYPKTNTLVFSQDVLAAKIQRGLAAVRRNQTSQPLCSCGSLMGQPSWSATRAKSDRVSKFSWDTHNSQCQGRAWTLVLVMEVEHMRLCWSWAVNSP